MAPSVFTELPSLAKILVPSLAVQGWTDTQEKLEGVTEIVAVVAIERIGAVIDRYLSTKTNVEALAVRQVADVTERVCTYRKDARVGGGTQDQLFTGFRHVFPAKINCVSSSLIIGFH